MSRVSRASVVIVIGLIVLGACSQSSRSPEGRAHAIETQVWSPYCPGRLLIDCTTSQSRELRADILERVIRGESQNEVIEWVRGEFGDEAIATGSGLLTWLVPTMVFAVGAIVLVLYVASTRRRGEIHGHP